MDFNVCFVCLKTIRSGNYPKRGLGLVRSPFWNFVKGYLGIKNAQNESAEEALFCEDCERCVGDICQLYSELVAVQLRLSVKLGDLGELLQNSKKTVSNKMGVALVRKLAGQMGFDKPAHVDQFRNLLIEKCQLKWRKSFPDVKIERIPTPKSCLNSNTDEQSEHKLEETEEDFIQAASLEEDYDMDEASIILPSPGPYSPTVSETDPLSDVPMQIPSTFSSVHNEDNRSSLKRSERIRVGMKKRRKRWVTKVKETYAKDEVDDKQDEDYIPEESESECTTSTKSRKKPGTIIVFGCPLTKIGSGETYKCSKCDGIIRSPLHNLRAHVVKEHTDRIVCSQCGEHFGTISSFKSHLAKHGHPTPKSPCIICGRPVSVIQMKAHVWTHYSEEDKAASLARGEKRPYARKAKHPFKCDLCSRSFCYMKRLEAHVKEKHAGPPPPKKKKLCPVCGEEVNDLVQHSKTHKLYDERKFVCVLCDKKFETQYALRRHKFNVHSDEKPIQCELCGKNFKTESNMKDHHKHIHVNGKVYQCGSCPRNFIQRFYYEKHLVNKHGIVTQLLEYGPDEQELKLEGTAATS